MGVAVIIGFGARGIDIPLAILTIAATMFGAIGSAAALEDISNLRNDMDEATGNSVYGTFVKTRNLGLLRVFSMALMGLTGLTLVIAAFAT